MPWGHCRNTSEFPFGSEWWTGHRWQGPDRHWQAQRWTECGWVSGRLCPPGRQEKTSTTGPAGSTESSRWWKTTQSQCSFLEFSFGPWGCCSLSAANALHWRALGVEQKTEAVRSILYSEEAKSQPPNYVTSTARWQRFIFVRWRNWRLYFPLYLYQWSKHVVALKVRSPPRIKKDSCSYQIAELFPLRRN